MTDEERKELVWVLRSYYRDLCGDAHEAADQIEADGQRIAELEEALGWFLNDSRFVVQVGGNPNVVPQMIEEAGARLGDKA